MSDQEIRIPKRSKPTGKGNYGTWSTSTEMALMRLKAWTVISDEPPPSPESFESNSKLGAVRACAALTLVSSS
jgi:hypothetical protein